jgi:hypothetical protein
MVVYATLYTKINGSRYAEKKFLRSLTDGVSLAKTMTMKQIGIALLAFFMIGCKSSDKKTQPTPPTTTTTTTTSQGGSLETRLAEFLKANDDMDLDKVMDYVYPKVYDIVPKADLLKAMKDGFDNNEVKIELDSLKIEKQHPVFEMENGSFSKMSYSMVMLMTFIDDDPNAKVEERNKMILATMEEKYGKGKVNFDEKGVLRIRVLNQMVAVKDEYAKDWCFVNLKEEDPMIAKLFSKEVLDKLATYTE